MDFADDSDLYQKILKMQKANQYFEESKSIIEKDTTYSFLYLSESVKYRIGQLDYLDCLNEKCIVEKQNETTVKLNICDHLYHEKCIRMSIEKSNLCPLCRKDIYDENFCNTCIII